MKRKVDDDKIGSVSGDTKHTTLSSIVVDGDEEQEEEEEADDDVLAYFPPSPHSMYSSNNNNTNTYKPTGPVNTGRTLYQYKKPQPQTLVHHIPMDDIFSEDDTYSPRLHKKSHTTPPAPQWPSLQYDDDDDAELQRAIQVSMMWDSCEAGDNHQVYDNDDDNTRAS